MKDIEFGKYLYSLRKQNKLTQRYVAYQLDVTDKAVSKWEMGSSKPDTLKLKQLSTLYNVSLDELLDPKNYRKSKVTVRKIVLTGGPCAGKTTAQNWISNYFSKRGYTVLFVPETATELISNGVTPWTCASNYDYQSYQIKLQKIKEEIFEHAALGMKTSKVLIVCELIIVAVLEPEPNSLLPTLIYVFSCVKVLPEELILPNLTSCNKPLAWNPSNLSALI